MGTLNGGFQHHEGSEKIMTESDLDLIAEFIKNKGITYCAPVEAQGSESSPSTHERIMDKRKVFRAKQRELSKANKANK
jgi:hypothetical protein